MNLIELAKKRLHHHAFKKYLLQWIMIFDFEYIITGNLCMLAQKDAKPFQNNILVISMSIHY